MITPWENFVYEGQTNQMANKLASDLRFIGRNSNYILTVYDGSVTVDYEPMTIHVSFNELNESEIERQGGESGKLYAWIQDKYRECQAKKESGYSDI